MVKIIGLNSIYSCTTSNTKCISKLNQLLPADGRAPSQKHIRFWPISLYHLHDPFSGETVVMHVNEYSAEDVL
jgi:hypothetical protein